MSSDMELFDRWCADDLQAGNELFARHFRSIQRFFDRKVEDDAQDLIQETFLVCVRNREKFRKHSSFRTYLFGIARMTLLSYWRKRSRRGEQIDFNASSIRDLRTPLSKKIARREEGVQLLSALASLPLESQSLIELFYWAELSTEELSEVFAVEVATIRSRLFRARAKLRESLSDDGRRTVQEFDEWARSRRP